MAEESIEQITDEFVKAILATEGGQKIARYFREDVLPRMAIAARLNIDPCEVFLDGYDQSFIDESVVQFQKRWSETGSEKTLPPEDTAQVSLSDEFQYKSTPDGSPPSGRRKKDTHRNVSFTGMKPEHIDRIDSECVEQGIHRAAWIMNAFGSKEGELLFHVLFEGVRHRHYAKVWQQIDNKIRTDSLQESLAPRQV